MYFLNSCTYSQPAREHDDYAFDDETSAVAPRVDNGDWEDVDDEDDDDDTDDGDGEEDGEDDGQSEDDDDDDDVEDEDLSDIIMALKTNRV